MEKKEIINFIAKCYEDLPEKDLNDLLASTARSVLRNRYVSPTIMDKDKEKVHNVYFLNGKFFICARTRDFEVTAKELLSIADTGAFENLEMTRTFYMVK